MSFCCHVQLYPTFSDCNCGCVCVVCVLRSWPGSVRRPWGCWRATKTKTTSLGSWRRRSTCWTEWVLHCRPFLLKPLTSSSRTLFLSKAEPTTRVQWVLTNYSSIRQVSRHLALKKKYLTFFMLESISLWREAHFLYVSVFPPPCGVPAPRRLFCWIKQNVKSVFFTQDSQKSCFVS